MVKNSCQHVHELRGLLHGIGRTTFVVVPTATGYLNKQDDGRYTGSIRTISIRADIEIIPNVNKSADTQPDYRVMTGGIEIGAG